MPDQRDVDATVRKVESAAHNGDHGAQNAYKALSTDFNAHVDQLKNNPAELQAYFAAVKGELNKYDPNLLHDMSLVWGQDQLKNKGVTDDNGDLQQSNLKGVLNPQHTEFSPLDREMAQDLLDQWKDVKTGVGGVPLVHWGGHDAITKDSLQGKLDGVDKTLKGQKANLPAEAAPIGQTQQTPADGGQGQGQGQGAATGGMTKLDKPTAETIVDAIRTLPQDVRHQFFPDGTTISADAVNNLLNSDKQTPSLTVAQRNALSQLETSFPQLTNGGNSLTLEQLAQACASQPGASDGQQTLQTDLQNEDAQVAQFLQAMSKESVSGITDNNGNITKNLLQQKLQSEGQQPDPALAVLYNQFDNVSKDGQTITANDMAAFAASHGQQFAGLSDGFKPTDSSTSQSPEAPPAQQPTDNSAQVDAAKQAFEQLPQSLTLGKDGKVLYDLATETLEARSKYTGEKIDNDAIMREVNRIMVDNGYPDAHLDGKTHITMADLPAKWNSVANGQVFKLYSDAEKQQFEQMIAQHMGAQQPTDAPPASTPPAAPTDTNPGNNPYNQYGGTPSDGNGGNGQPQTPAPEVQQPTPGPTPKAGPVVTPEVQPTPTPTPTPTPGAGIPSATKASYEPSNETAPETWMADANGQNGDGSQDQTATS